MWMRFAQTLRCPLCAGALHLEPFECSSVALAPEAVVHARELDVHDERFDQYVESGLLLCKSCHAKFPVIDGLPILLCYTTPMHATFNERYAPALARFAGYAFPEREPANGERAVMRSFSREWLDYDYDGVIWEMSYDDHERRFLSEIGPALTQRPGQGFLEVGCGLGITTFLAHKNSRGDAVGLDLSLAVWKACRHYRDNPFLHFVQASAFAMPFPKASFDLIYSRGVLHHTYSTQRAFESMAPLCRPEGTLYLWVYGMGSIRETVFRRAVYGIERVFRPALAAAPNSGAAKAFLAAMGVGYLAFNGLRRTMNPAIQPLTLARGVHAARDRFTPQYAHRHEADEVAEWFRRAGFGETQIVDWKTMPAADHDDFRRNVGVRGRLRSFTV
jgi:ubiquinone/menaquinone biosynthesis C-methylase UbiE/uncharacterized protein YbaR (Trm112 family)